MVGSALPRSTPEAQGVPSAAVEALVRELDAQDAVHGMVLVRHGTVIAEGWWAPYTAERPHSLYSVSKSFTSAAVGLALDEGLFGIDDRVADLLPHDLPADPDPRLARLTLRHLLTMTSGHGGRSFEPRDQVTVASALGTPFTDEPGARFVYDTGDTFLAGAILQRHTGGSLLDYLRPRLFAPLGIEPGWWERSADGLDRGGTGLGLTTEALARFGQTLLQRGRWGERQVLPAGWVDAATGFQVANDGPDTSPDWSQGYGWQFWRCTHGAYRADGAFGQFVLVMPEQDAVLAITSGLTDMQAVLDAVWQELLPHLGAERAEDPLAHEHLRARLAQLRMPPQYGTPTSPRSRELEGVHWELRRSLPGITGVTVRPVPGGGWRLAVDTASGPQELELGAGDWTHARADRVFGPNADVATSAAWVGDEFRMRVVFLTTPFTITGAFRVEGDELRIRMTQNAAFDDATDLGELVGRRS